MKKHRPKLRLIVTPEGCCCHLLHGWMAYCRVHGWTGNVDVEHLTWLLLKYPQDREKILEAADPKVIEQMRVQADFIDIADVPSVRIRIKRRKM